MKYRNFEVIFKNAKCKWLQSKPVEAESALQAYQIVQWRERAEVERVIPLDK